LFGADESKTVAMDILIVEDDFLLGLSLAEALHEGGHRVLGPASCRVEALGLLAGEAPQLALVDIELRGGDSGIELAAELRRRGVPCVFATGQPEKAREHRGLALGLLAKPYSPAMAVAAAHYIAASYAGEPPARVPAGLELFSAAAWPALARRIEAPETTIAPCGTPSPAALAPPEVAAAAALVPHGESPGEAGVLEGLSG
jgi:DNA-binding response OmpR family regulator